MPRKSMEERLSRVKAMSKEELDSVMQETEASKSHLVLAPKNRKRYEAIKEEYETLVPATGRYNKDDLWDADKFIDCCTCYTSIVIRVCEGSIEDEIKAGSLYGRKRALQAYATSQIPQFEAMYVRWNAALGAHIHYIANQHKLGTTEQPNI